jgi:hypothetical protein
MSDNAWTWANLSSQQRQMLAEAEKALGADFLLAFQHPDASASNIVNTPPKNIEAAPLTDSQLECLRGLEEQLHTVVVAYQKK